MNDMINQKKRLILFAITVLIVMPSQAFANAGIPMLVVVWPMMWVLLIPIIILEAAIAKRKLDIDWPASLKLAGKANIYSTFIGIPLTWAAFFGIEMIAAFGLEAVKFQSSKLEFLLFPFYLPWLPPPRENGGWIIPLAAALLCIPFFFISVWLEGRSGCKTLGKERVLEVKDWSYKANLASYGAIIAGLLVLTGLIYMFQK